jgi:hypothetical protein
LFGPGGASDTRRSERAARAIPQPTLLPASHLRPPPPTSAPAGDEGLRALQLFSWDSQRRVGGDLAEPRWLAWDPTLTMVALGYPQQVG